MDWTTPLSTLVGASIGIGSTLLVDIIRSKRDRVRRFEDVRRQVYAKYLEALTNTDGELQMLAVSQSTPVDEVDTRIAWRKHSLLALRYDLLLVAPEPVAEAADAAYRRLRNMRNAIRTSKLRVGNRGEPEEDPGSPEWEAVHLPYIKAIETLRSAMRADIQRGLGR